MKLSFVPININTFSANLIKQRLIVTNEKMMNNTDCEAKRVFVNFSNTHPLLNSVKTTEVFDELLHHLDTITTKIMHPELFFVGPMALLFDFGPPKTLLLVEPKFELALPFWYVALATSRHPLRDFSLLTLIPDLWKHQLWLPWFWRWCCMK